MVYLLVLQLPRHPVPVNSNGAVAETSEVFCFPFPKIPEKSWSNGGHQFGAPRKAKDGSARKHAGCDLIFLWGRLFMLLRMEY
jgi:hypothetical protein